MGLVAAAGSGVSSAPAGQRQERKQLPASFRVRERSIQRDVVADRRGGGGCDELADGRSARQRG
eukprot:363411-Chlamydomonas_euryale.AAC.1